MRDYAQVPTMRYGVKYTTCDACGKGEAGEPDDWVHVTSGHNDWGNDSVDSDEEHDACSPECLISVLQKIVDDYAPKYAGGEPTLRINVGTMGHVFAKGLLAR